MNDGFQISCMLVLALTCFVSAGDWIAAHQAPATAFTFLSFGLGYIGLACLFGGLK
jgi:hypothetical protein